MNLKICYLKIYVSCEASVNFQHISQNATPATQFAPCRHLTAALTIDSQNTQHDTSKVLRLPRKMTMEVAKVLRLPRKIQLIFLTRRKSIAPAHTKRLSTRYEKCWTVTKCQACHGETKLRGIGNHQSDHFCRTCHMHGHTGLTQPPANSCGWLRTVSDGCDRKRNVKRTHPQPRDPQSETGTLATHSGIRRITTMSTPSHSIHHGRFLQARNPHTLASRDQNCSTTMWLLEALWLLNNCTQHNKQKCSENIF